MEEIVERQQMEVDQQLSEEDATLKRRKILEVLQMEVDQECQDDAEEEQRQMDIVMDGFSAEDVRAGDLRELQGLASRGVFDFKTKPEEMPQDAKCIDARMVRKPKVGKVNLTSIFYLLFQSFDPF